MERCRPRADSRALNVFLQQRKSAGQVHYADLKKNAARKVERVMNKRIAAVALQNRIGQTFAAVVTGVTPKGVFVRVLDPPAEGLLMRGQQGVDVGDRP